MNPDAAIPKAPLALGLAGLIPFWGLALAIAAGWAPFGTTASASVALATYGAVIVSFLGGIRWGLATAAPASGSDWASYGFAVVPSLVAWGALALPLPATLALLGGVALALGPIDGALVKAGKAPAWFGRLRIILSLGAGGALVLAALVSVLAHPAA